MRYLLYCLVCLCMHAQTKAQVSIGPGEQLYVFPGATFSVDSLYFIPSVALSISNNTLIRDYIPIPGLTSGRSIARVYRFATAVPYTGELGIVYDEAELAGNAESALQMAYRNTAWTTTTNSNVILPANIVYNTSIAAPLGIITATSLGTVLPIVVKSFSAVRQTHFVALDWKMSDMEGLTGFEVQYSADARNWTTATSIQRQLQQSDYSFHHNDLLFTKRFYRIVLLENTGGRKYTNVIMVRSNEVGTALRITRNGNGLSLYFDGTLPNWVQVYNTKGQLLRAGPVTKQPFTITGLAMGAYVIHYVVEGKKLSRVVYY